MNSTTFPTLKAFAIMAAAVVATGSTAFAQADQNQKTEQEKPVVRVSLDSNGVLTGYVFAMLDDEQAPMLANVTLAAGGKTVASGDTDVVGQFSFKDVEPGEYTMVGVSGEYTGNQTVVVMPAEQALETEEAYASVGLQVAYDNEYAYAGGDAVYGGDVVYTDAATSGFACGGSCGSTCASACGGGCGGGIGGGGGIAGGGNFRRLALIGAAVAIPVAIASDDPASPDN